MAKRWKRTLILLLIAAVLGGFWRAVLYVPRLRPVTHRIVPSDMGFRYSVADRGYPILQGERQGYIDTYPITWLDDRCRPIPGCDQPCDNSVLVSPNRRVMAADRPSPVKTEIPVYWREGKKVVLPPKAFRQIALLGVTDDGCCYDYYGNVTYPDGRCVPLSRAGHHAHLFIWHHVQCADSRYLAMVDQYCGKLFLYDIAARRLTFNAPVTLPQYGESAIVFTHRARLVYATTGGEAIVFDGGRPLKTIHAADGWQWGEDGSLWYRDTQGIQLLRWRDGAPRLTAFAIACPRDKRFLTWDGCDTAVWGNGTLIAHTKTTTRLPALLERVLGVISHTADDNQRYRRLILLRHGRRIGTCTVPLRLPAPGATWTPLFTEHLAFTADGRYLAWLINPGGRTHLYVFRAS